MRLLPTRERLRVGVAVFVLYSALTTGVVLYATYPFQSSQTARNEERHAVIAEPAEGTSHLLEKLYKDGFIRSRLGIRFVHGADALFHNIMMGSYTLSKEMSLWEVYGALANPTSRWVSIPPGLRREEIASRLDSSLLWDSGDKEKFINLHERFGRNPLEGYYFPGTYLLAINDSGTEVGSLMVRRFDENVTPRIERESGKAIRLDTAVTIASLIQREAAGPADMRLISGIIWNRIFAGMNLQIDASLQYAKGTEKNGWWPRIMPRDKYLESPFNTYLHEGLPPAPISNPGLAAIDAAYRPVRTSCLFYFHDKARRIHCSRTNDDHERKLYIYYGPPRSNK